MHKMSIFFYCLCAGLSPFIFTSPLKAATLELGSKECSMDFFWTKDDENLYFNFDIPEGMSFGDEYALIEEAQVIGCEFVIQGNEELPTQMRLKVFVENVPSLEKVRYKIESVVKTSVEDFFASQTFSHEGFIRSLQINSKKEPQLRIKSSNSTHGVIVFMQI